MRDVFLSGILVKIGEVWPKLDFIIIEIIILLIDPYYLPFLNFSLKQAYNYFKRKDPNLISIIRC
jgi:hypothetical protein